MSSKMAATISGWIAGWRRSNCSAAPDLGRASANHAGNQPMKAAQRTRDKSSAARRGKRAGRRHRCISRAASRSCDARDHDRHRRDQRAGERQRKPAGLAGPPQGPRRPRHDQPEPVHRRRKTARGFYPRAFVAARDIRLVGADRRPLAHIWRRRRRDDRSDRRIATARAARAWKPAGRSFPGC